MHKILFWFIIAFFILFTALVLLNACVSAPEKPCSDNNQSICINGRANLCLDGNWIIDDDCKEVYLFDGGVDRWSCCTDTDGAYCSPTCGN